MNTFLTNNYNMRYNQRIPWNRNERPRGHNIQRKYYFNPFQSLPGSEKYWCETCDKGFMTRTILDYHKQKHQKCNIDGCQFVAHPKVITKHIQMQHATGLYKRIGKLNNPEEIKKWREERKRKYPTKENIEKKQAEITEKIRRGEKMGLKCDINGVNKRKSGFHNKRQQNITCDKNIKTLNIKNNAPQLFIKKRPVKNTVYKTVFPKEESRKLQPFKGIQDLVVDDIIEDDTPEECNGLIVDEDVTYSETVDKTISNPTVCGALTSLICNYESTDEEDIEKTIKTTCSKISNNLCNGNTTVHPKINTNVNNDLNVSNVSNKLSIKNDQISKTENNTTCHNESENESGPEEATITKAEHIKSNESKPAKCAPSRKERLKKYENAKTKHRIVNLKKKLPSTLLEKLLHKEIQHERNVILQCVRYVVKNGYFDKI